VTLPQVQSGDLRVLATTGAQRSTLLAAVPTFQEVGFPTLEDIDWFGVFVPAKTPRPVVEKINLSIPDPLKTPEFRAGLEKLAFAPAGCSPEEFARLIKSDFDRWARIVKETGFTAEN